MSKETTGQIRFEGRAVEIVAGERLLTALRRVGEEFGGCLCLAGDCPHCLVTVDGVAYQRSCQVASRPGMEVVRQPLGARPPLPEGIAGAKPEIVRHDFTEVVVIGQGEAGQMAAAEARGAGREVVTLDARQGEEVVGVYPGPLVVARTSAGMRQIHLRSRPGQPPPEIIVATGAAEIQPVAPGNQLAGILTVRAAEELLAAGIDGGRMVLVVSPSEPAEGTPSGFSGRTVSGRILRFEGERQVSAVVVALVDGAEERIECETVIVGLGWQPRDALARMGRGVSGVEIRVVGDAAGPATLPAVPEAGVLCHCTGVTVDDLASVVERGFDELELVKRATLAGTGTCQGAACLPHLRSFLAAGGKPTPAPFTARPLTRQLTMGEAAAGACHPPTPRTALDEEHRQMGARMERMGGWWRPWNYGGPSGQDQDAVWREYEAVRHAVSLGDVSTLGKIVVSGPDALELLERLYPTRVATIRPGRMRYVLLLDDRGYLLDDGMICREDETRFLLTFTSGGATFAELWVRDWAEAFGLDVRIMNVTLSRGAINVTGPHAKELLARAGLVDPPAYLRHVHGEVAGVACQIMRLSFTGEISYELHHEAADSVRLWRRLLDLGAELGIRPHGLEALLKLRLEKGHLIVGQDTDFDSTPRRLDHEWAVRLDKPDFVGKVAVQRTNRVALNRQLVGFAMEGEAPAEGAVIWYEGQYAGYVTSSTWSPALGRSVMLGWLYLFDGELPEEVTIGGRPAQRASTPFYDPEGGRARG